MPRTPPSVGRRGIRVKEAGSQRLQPDLLTCRVPLYSLAKSDDRTLVLDESHESWRTQDMDSADGAAPETC